SNSVNGRRKLKPVRRGAGEKAAAAQVGPDTQGGETPRNGAERDSSQIAGTATLAPRLDLHRFVGQLKIQSRDPCRREAQISARGEPRVYRHRVHGHLSRGAYAWLAAVAVAAGGGVAEAGAPCGERDLAFSSFIIGEGATTASLIATMRWRSTASLNLNACSSSVSVASPHSIFIST